MLQHQTGVLYLEVKLYGKFPEVTAFLRIRQLTRSGSTGQEPEFQDKSAGVSTLCLAASLSRSVSLGRSRSRRVGVAAPTYATIRCNVPELRARRDLIKFLFSSSFRFEAAGSLDIRWHQRS
ncbi:hypothetical protein J6590_077036 [Homalodisca vitripennis]|nr:hypothetical protein J6590_077036 [Homalodisca vitripennis]